MTTSSSSSSKGKRRRKGKGNGNGNGNGQHRELREFFIGDRVLLAPPKEIRLIQQRIHDDRRFRRLMKRFSSGRLRQQMFASAWRFLNESIEHRLKIMSSGVYFACYGPRGMGKSEVIQTIGLHIISAYRRFTDWWPVELAFARNAADMNTQLAKATAENVTIMLLGDEEETGVGIGSNTEEQALIDNLETIRVLGHSVARTTIKIKKIWSFVSHCDFVLRTLFQDRRARVNYCLLSILDEDADELVPMYIIDVPLHDNQQIREGYLRLKRRDQQEFTASRGRRSRIRETLRPFVEALVKRVEERELSPRVWTELKPLLVLDEAIQGGDTLTMQEIELVCRAAFMKLSERRRESRGRSSDRSSGRGGEVQYPAGAEVSDIDMERIDELMRSKEWGKEFTWRDEIAALLADHPQWGKYHTHFVASEVLQLRPQQVEEYRKITGLSKSQNYTWRRKMLYDAKFQGWLKTTRAILHEEWLAQQFEAAGWSVTRKPSFELNGLRYEEDLLIERDGPVVLEVDVGNGERERIEVPVAGYGDGERIKIWINAKCGEGFRTYVKNEYATTYLARHTLGESAYIFYTDLNTGNHYIFEPGERVSIGKGDGALVSTRDRRFINKLYNLFTHIKDFRTTQPSTPTDRSGGGVEGMGMGMELAESEAVLVALVMIMDRDRDRDRGSESESEAVAREGYRKEAE